MRVQLPGRVKYGQTQDTPNPRRNTNKKREALNLKPQTSSRKQTTPPTSKRAAGGLCTVPVEPNVEVDPPAWLVQRPAPPVSPVSPLPRPGSIRVNTRPLTGNAGGRGHRACVSKALRPMERASDESSQFPGRGGGWRFRLGRLGWVGLWFEVYSCWPHAGSCSTLG